MNSHTIGMLVVGTDNLVDIRQGSNIQCLRPKGGGTIVAITGGVNSVDAAIVAEDARRLAACWNACDGVPTEKIEAYSEAIGITIRDGAQKFSDLKTEIAQLKADYGEAVDSVAELQTALDGARALLARDVKAEISNEPSMVEEAAWALMRVAGDYGYVLTITQRPRMPLAMGNYDSVVSVRPARVMAKKGGK